MMKRYLSLCLIIGVFMAAAAFTHANIRGDVDYDGRVGLKEAVYALQVISNIITPPTNIDADVDCDGQIGLQEAIYALQVSSGITTPPVNIDADCDGFSESQGDCNDFDPTIYPGATETPNDNLDQDCDGSDFLAQGQTISPLTDAAVNLYFLNDQNTPVYTSQTDNGGLFSVGLPGNPDDSTLVLVQVSGGNDLDADDDGTVDTVPTANSGTFSGLYTVAELKAGKVVISPITDIAWRYTANLYTRVSDDLLFTRLDNIALTLLKDDLNGDGIVDHNDLNGFSPVNAAHKNSLSFDYQLLSQPDDTGMSLMSAHYDNLSAEFHVLLENIFGEKLSLYPASVYENTKVKIEVVAFGEGSFSSDIGTIDFNSSRPANDNTTYDFYGQSPTTRVTLTAAPTAETEILQWDGCDTVSEDKTRCECTLGADHLVTVSFGYKTASLRAGIKLADLTNTSGIFNQDRTVITVTAGLGDTSMIAELADLQVGDFIVGSTDNGYLASVAAIQKNSDIEYAITLGEAGLDDIVGQGSGVFSKQMTHGDLAPAAQPATTTSGTAPMSVSNAIGGFEAIAGVSLLPAIDPNEKLFRLKIGEPQGRTPSSLVNPDFSGAVTWTDPYGGGTMTVSGEINLTIEVETGASYKSGSGLQYFKFIPRVTAEENLAMEINGELATREGDIRQEIASFTFTPISFFIGVVPVWITPTVKIYIGADARVGAVFSSDITLRQELRAGIVYNLGAGINTFASFASPAVEFNGPITTRYADVNGYVSGYVQPTHGMLIYGVPGPAVSVQSYLKLRGQVSSFRDDLCSGGLNVSVYWGCRAGLEWESGQASKIGRMQNVDQLNLDMSLYNDETLFRGWNIGGSCNPRPPFLEVTGTDIIETVVEGEGGILTTTYTIENTGDLDMPWEASYIVDGVTTVTPVKGTLAGDSTETITVTTDTSSLSLGDYVNTIRFANTYGGGTFSFQLDGDTERDVLVTVVPPDLLAPVMTQPQRAMDSAGNPRLTVVNLGWSYPDAQSKKYVQGYSIYYTLNPANPFWLLLKTISKPDETATQVHLNSDSTYYFKMSAYGKNTGGAMSNKVAIYLPPTSTAPGTVVSGNKVWMDKNLGASRIATSITDAEAYGDLYQWGRGTDGHEKRTSSTTSTVSSSDSPNHGRFITENTHWQTTINDNLWQGVSGVNNPCPSGFRLPTYVEMYEEIMSWDVSLGADAAFASPLKLVLAGRRAIDTDGSVYYEGIEGCYWTSNTLLGTWQPVRYLSVDTYNDSYIIYPNVYRANGFSVRCILD